MEGYTKVKSQYNHVLCFLVWALLIFSITACEKQNPDVQNSASNLKSYKHNGLEINYPEAWLFERDGQDWVQGNDSIALSVQDADRRVSFETPDLSAIYVYFYKTRPKSLLDSEKSTVSELHLENNEDVSGLQRKKVNINGYDGLKLKWTKKGIIGETKSELTIIELKSKPYPVHVQFYLFDDDIVNQNINIIPFLEGITFDPQGVKL